MNIILYSNDCPKCNILKSKLKEKKIDFETCCDVDFMVKKGFNNMPMLEVDGNIMDFYTANQFINERGI